MRLAIDHVTECFYEPPIGRGMQRLRFTPRAHSGQRIVEWDVDVDGGETQASYRDQYGNEVRLISLEPDTSHVRVRACGIVETIDTSGVIAADPSVPTWVFLRSTELTEPGPLIAAMVEPFTGASNSDVAIYHELSELIADRVDYTTNATTVSTAAEEAVATGRGVCQDHAHVFVAAARLLGAPARYASGYLCTDVAAQASAMHAWAEVHIDDLGWVGFDPSNRVSPDERYVRVAVGLDYDDVPPSSGVWQGGGEERLAVALTVSEQAGSDQ